MYICIFITVFLNLNVKELSTCYLLLFSMEVFTITGNDSDLPVGLIGGKEWWVWCVSRCSYNGTEVHVCSLTITL